MPKTAKSVLADKLKSNVTPCSEGLETPYYIIDGGHLLHVVTWPRDCTYAQLCETYTSHVLNHYGTDSTVIFDGYTDHMSTKVAEQQRRATQHMSPDILLEPEMVASTPQNQFLGNRHNKARFIARLVATLDNAGISCSQSTGDADHLISSTALTAAHIMDRPVILVGNDTDLLVMLVDKAIPTMNIFMQFSSYSLTIYSIIDIQNALHEVAKKHILFANAVTGCDTVSALYGVGKQKALAVLQNDRIDWDVLDVFQQPNSNKDDIAQAGETFILKLYGATQSTTLDRYRYVRYMKQVSTKSLTSDGFRLELLPPTSAAAKFHSYRTYYTVQQWLGNDEVVATDRGWHFRDGMLHPIGADRPVAPERVMRIVSCGCKVACGKRCKCHKAGLFCTVMCSTCNGQTCANVCRDDADNWDTTHGSWKK